MTLLIGAVAVYRFDVLDRWWPRPAPDPSVEPAVVAPPAELELPAPEPAETVATAQPVDRAARLLEGRVRGALRSALKDPDLGRHVVVDVQTVAGVGPTYHHGKPALFTPASTTKLLTGVAALKALGPEHTFSTVVRQGTGNRIVLVGGGDPYLARKPLSVDRSDSVYPPRADIRTLARTVAEELRRQGRSTVRLGYDATLFTGPADNPRWEPTYVPEGVVAPITSLWVDQGRRASGFGRVADPAQAAATAFAGALSRQGIAVRGRAIPTVADAAGAELGRVEGAALSQVVEHVMDVSDNEAAEVLARHVGLAVVDEGSFTGAIRGVRRELAALGVTVRGSQWYDGSGLSRENRLTGDLVLDVLRVASSSDHPELRAAVTGLPVSGFSGSLTDRFSDGPRAALGRVRAKTGTLVEGGVHGLAGYVTDATGTPLLFVAVADKVAVRNSGGARDAIDRIAAELADCLCSHR